MKDYLLQKIKDLWSKFKAGGAGEQDLVSIKAWEDKAKRLILLDSLKGHAGMKYVYDIFETEVSQINNRLLASDSKALPDAERDRLIDRRALASKYLDLFKNVEKDLEEMEQEVDNELSRVE